MTEKIGFGIGDAVETYKDAETQYAIQGRGRPERKPHEAALRILRRRAFGAKLRDLRMTAQLTLSRAASLANMASPRKLSQYETTCYPGGEIVTALAPHYGVTEKDLAEMVLQHSDPDLFTAITGRPGYQPSDEAVEAFLKKPDISPEEDNI